MEEPMPHLAIVEDYRHTEKPSPSIRNIVAELHDRRLGEDEIVAALVERIERDHSTLESAARFIVQTMLTEAETRERRRSSMPTREERGRRQELTSAQARAIAARITLDLMMPNGKRLRYCSGAEVGAFGVAFGKIAERVGPDKIVGAVLCEQEIRELLAPPS
jgi:hypothetical protein